jgi:hypothetical protein
VGAIGTPDYVADASAGAKAERDELDWLLTSGVLGRSTNLIRVLTYICEEHFAGRTDQIKEHTIAVEALGRRPDFDPQTDIIVRVTVHSLRKRLQEVYQNEGSARPMRLEMPPGRYSPCFVPGKQLEPPAVSVLEQEPLPIADTDENDTIFENIQASADGRIELSFLPVVNYPVINAIEVLPEE